MPYVGNIPTSNFASVTKDLFSGDGSTVAFTLSKASTTNGVAVFVENVRQEPTIAYAVSGTTLTFTAAPVTSSGNNIYVLHHNAVASTANHPAAQDLTAVNGTFTGNIDVDGTTDLDGLTSSTDVKLLKGDSSAISQYFQNSSTGSGATDGVQIALGSSEDFQIWNYENTALTIATNNAEALKIDANGHITMAKQSAFLTLPSSTVTNYSIDTNHTVAFGTEVFDNNNDFASNTFTAPVTGRYQLNCMIYAYQLDSAAAYYYVMIVTSNRSYMHIVDPDYGQDNTYYTFNINSVADMDASDTAFIRFFQSGGTAQTDIIHDSGGTYFSGCLLA